MDPRDCLKEEICVLEPIPCLGFWTTELLTYLPGYQGESKSELKIRGQRQARQRKGNKDFLPIHIFSPLTFLTGDLESDLQHLTD